MLCVLNAKVLPPVQFWLLAVPFMMNTLKNPLKVLLVRLILGAVNATGPFQTQGLVALPITIVLFEVPELVVDCK